jgi:signal transduction histidine kinase
MKRRLKQKIQHSIFIKISLLMVLSIFITIAAVTFFGALLIHNNFPEDLYKGYEYFVDRLIDEWGNPPAKQKLEELSERYNLKIYYQGPEYTWTHAFPPVDLHFLQSRFNTPKSSLYSFAFSKGYLLVKRKLDQHAFILAFSIIARGRAGSYSVTVLILLLTLLFILLYFSIRRLLYPIHYLLTGVKHIQKGDFSYQIPVTQTDELGKLSLSFNQMTKLLEDMIKTKDQLLLDVSHELRSPLTRIKVALEFIDNEPIQQNIAGDIHEMEYMILELLETERMKSEYGKARFKDIDIIQLLKDVLKNYQTGYPALDCVFPDLPIFLSLDEIRIKMLFKNLLDNARRYSKPESLPINVLVENYPDYAAIRIQDCGVGIAAKDLPYVFEPFFRTDLSRSKETGGYGLGLYICKKIVEHHGGEITIQSQEEQGTIITVKFYKNQSI